MKEYHIDIYDNNFDDTSRYILGTSGAKPLIVVGLNPSTANEEKPDMTISKVKGFIKRNNFDSFLMINLYPQRATNPDELDLEIDQKKHKMNLTQIIKRVSIYEEINLLASWGEPITKRSFLTSCLNDLNNILKNQKVNWLMIGDLTKSGHPRHPSRASYSNGLKSFEIVNYLDKLRNAYNLYK